MGAPARLYSFLAQQQSRAQVWPSCISTTCTDGLDYPQKSFRIETPALPHTSDAPLLRKLAQSRICRQHSTPRQTDSQNGRINGSNSTYASLPARNKKIGVNGSR